MKASEAFHVKTRNVILGIRWSDIVSNVDVQARTGLTALGEILAARRISVFGRLVPAHMALHRRTLICQLVVLLVVTGDDVLVARARCIDQTAWKGLEQITSGTLEVCHPPWGCCWSDATAPAGYVTLMMMMMMISSMHFVKRTSLLLSLYGIVRL